MPDVNVKTVGLFAAIILVAGAGWFFVSPLFVDETVDESLPLSAVSSQAGLPTRAEVMAMSDEAQSVAMEQVMASMATAPDLRVEDGMMPTTGPEVIRRGVFRDADAIHRGSGDALVYQLPDGSQLLRLENFRVTNGPALVVYLSKHPDPDSAADVLTGFMSLGKLKGNVGNQNYVIPAGTDVSEFNSVVIWCELFDVLFSPAALTTG